MEEKKSTIKKVWKFIWEDDSIWSWIVNVILAYVLIKFLVYPGLGYALQTTHPIVAVVSGSMEHNGNFEEWWNIQKNWYEPNNISKNEFKTYRFTNGFNKGDIMLLKGKKAEDLKKGDVIVFKSYRPDPIIHRIVYQYNTDAGRTFQTKGDNNADSIRSNTLDETRIQEEQVIGTAWLRVPLLGYIKIWFVELLKIIGLVR